MTDATLADTTTSAPARRDVATPVANAIMLAPALVMCTVFIFIPAALSIVGSFYSFGLTSQNWVWEGFGNYERAAQDPIFWVALRNNVIIVIGSIMVLAFAVGWGYLNYARAADVDGLKSEVSDIKVQLLSQSILAAHKEKCESESSGKFSPYWQEHLAKLKNQYWRMTGQAFELPPSC